MKRLSREKGASSVEYLIILVLVVLTQIAAFKVLGGHIRTKMTQATALFQSEVNPQ